MKTPTALTNAWVEDMSALRAYRLIYPDSPHAPPHLWECEQPYIEHLLTNPRTFGRRVVQRYFRHWNAYAAENARIWRRYYLPKPLYQPWATWEAWQAEYRILVVDVQAIYEASCRAEHPCSLHLTEKWYP